MAYINKVQKDSAAKAIAELVDLASYREVGTSALCMKDLCSTLGIDPQAVMAHLPDELVNDRDFTF